MTLEAGFGRTVINPKTPVMLAGFGDRTSPANKIHDDLEARVLCLVQDDGVMLCLVVCDLLGMSVEFSDPVRESIAGELGIGKDAVLTSCTHTHHGPNVMKGGEGLGWITPEGYAETLTDACRRAAVAARAATEPAFLKFVRAQLPDGLSVNRRGYPYEPWFSVLDILREDGSRIGTVFNLAIHPVSLGSEWLEVSGDWVGPFRSAVEESVGGMAIMLSGALGDVNPRGWEGLAGPGGNFSNTEALGKDIASAALARLPDCESVEGRIAVASSRTIDVPVSPTPLVELTGLTDPIISVELIEWSLGSVRLVSIPGEAFQAFGKAVDEARGGRTLLAGISPSWHGYLPQPFGAGYEETVSFGEGAVLGILEALTDVAPMQ